MPPARRVSGSMVIPLPLTGRRWMRGSPVGGASTSSSSVTPCALASGSSSSRVGRRSPDSSRDRVLTEMPVEAERSASVVSRVLRRAFSRGPTVARAWSRSSSMPPVCHIGNNVCCHARRRACFWRGGGRMAEQLEDNYDVVVIGGGAAGLNGAMMLARSRRSVAVIDAGAPRNAPADAVHGLLGHDGIAPAALVERGRSEVRRYGGRVVAGEVTGIARDEHGFDVTLADGTSTRARRLLVTTGLVDVLPEVPGVRERWGRDVLHCPYCHGWEVRDRTIGVLSSGPMAVHQTLLFRQLTADLTLFLHTGPRPTDEEVEQLAARGITVVEGEVASLEVNADRLTGVRLQNGEVIPRSAVVVGPRFAARAGMLAGLGLETTDHPSGMGEHVEAGATGLTAVPGVWVAGNVTDLTAHVLGSASAGAMAGAAINADLVAEDTREAVATPFPGRS